jgi:HKD family nuclease
MPHQIIDNYDIKLIDEINKQLDYAEKAKIAVGYFYLSGLKAIREKLAAKHKDGSYKIKEVRLLIGNSNSQLSVEHIAQKYRTDGIIEKELEKQRFHKDTDQTAVSRKRELIDQTVKDVKNTISELDQSEESISTVSLLHKMIIEKRLKVKVYTRGRLHAKAYILDFLNPQPNSKGIAIVGSSNLSLAGFTSNAELNVYVHDNGENHDALTKWYNRLWEEAEDFEAAIKTEFEESWPIYQATPYDIYMKTLYTLLKERLEGGDGEKFLWENEITEDLADFQKKAVKILAGIVRQYGGAFAADVVGVGKSYISAAVAKHFLISEGLKPLIVCPKTLQEMWETYNAKYSLNAQILPMSLLREGPENDGDWNFLFSDEKFKDRKFILIDESHNFRHSSPQRYKILQEFIHSSEKKVLLVTATPRNKSAKDIYNQIKLFHPNDKTNLPISPPDLKEYFKDILSDSIPKERRDSLLKNLLQQILYRRTRNHILRWWGYDSKTHKKVDPYNFTPYLEGKKRAYILVGGEHRFFPKRNIDTVTYSIEDTYRGLYKSIRKHLGKAKFDYSGDPIPGELTYARFALWHYVKRAKRKVTPYRDLHRAGINLRGLMRVMLFKRFESSVYAFRKTIDRLVGVHQKFLMALNNGIIPAGEEAQNILSGSDLYSEQDFVDALRNSAGDKNYDIEDFDVRRLKKHLKHDLDILEKIYEIVDESTIPPEKDAKLQKLKEILKISPLKKRRSADILGIGRNS